MNSGEGTIGESTYKNPPSPICSTPESTAADVNTDCEQTYHSETTIAVNPTAPLNLVGGANDIQNRLSSAPPTPSASQTYVSTLLSRAHVTFDGGKTWSMYPIDFHGYDDTSDPAVAFDASGTAYYSTLGFVFSQAYGCCSNPDVLVAHSGDGGRTWSSAVRVASGAGNLVSSPGVLNDKEYVAAWGDGNAIVTWTRFNHGLNGSYINSPIYDSVTHDGGATWSAPAPISGSAAFCGGAQGGNDCDQDQASVPVIAADGSIHVAFWNYSNDPTGRDQYLVVDVDPATGQRIAGPHLVGQVFDGFTDYPINIIGYQTLQDSEFRTLPWGNIAADPTDANHLAVIWSDMRNSTLPAPADPYSATTNSDIIVSQSVDGGVTWSSPTAITKPRDQFMPWGAYDAGGNLRIGYFDRSYDSANHQYGYTLATEKTPGSLKFSFVQLTTQLSDPTRDDRWQSGATPNPNFPHPATYIGDFSGIAATPSGVAALWTDMRVNVCFITRCGASLDVFFAAHP